MDSLYLARMFRLKERLKRVQNLLCSSATRNQIAEARSVLDQAISVLEAIREDDGSAWVEFKSIVHDGIDKAALDLAKRNRGFGFPTKKGPNSLIEHRRVLLQNLAKALVFLAQDDWGSRVDSHE